MNLKKALKLKWNWEEIEFKRMEMEIYEKRHRNNPSHQLSPLPLSNLKI